MSPSADDELVIVGRITSAYGVKGWLKVYSETEPMQGILQYQPWLLKLNEMDWVPTRVLAGRPHAKGLIVQLQGCDDRNAAEGYRGALIAVNKASLPTLTPGDYYWHQLEGLRVMTDGADSAQLLLGRVDHLLETGANDVLVVRACAGSIDQRERLIPYLVGSVVSSVDVEQGEIQVDWDPEF